MNPSLPQDRESVYWVNVKAIPSQNEENEGKNVLQIAVRTSHQAFYRPAGLKGDIKSSPGELRFTRNGKQIKLTIQLFLTSRSVMYLLTDTKLKSPVWCQQKGL